MIYAWTVRARLRAYRWLENFFLQRGNAVAIECAASQPYRRWMDSLTALASELCGHPVTAETEVSHDPETGHVHVCHCIVVPAPLKRDFIETWVHDPQFAGDFGWMMHPTVTIDDYSLLAQGDGPTS